MKWPSISSKFSSSSDLLSATQQALLDTPTIRQLFLQGLQHQIPLVEDSVTGDLSGDFTSVKRGSGLDYEESRTYQQGDEPRYINWRLSARTGNLQMKVFREERCPTLLLLIDRRSTMRFATRNQLKLTQALKVAITIAGHYHQQTSLMSLLMDDQLRWSSTAVSEQGVLNLLIEAASAAPPINDLSTQVTLGQALDLMQEKLALGSTVYLLSDFIDLAETHRSRLLALSERADVHAIHLFDPAEKKLPQSGMLRFINQQGEQQINTSNPDIQRHYQKVAEQHFRAKKMLLEDLGIRYQMISTLDETYSLTAHAH